MPGCVEPDDGLPPRSENLTPYPAAGRDFGQFLSRFGPETRSQTLGLGTW